LGDNKCNIFPWDNKNWVWIDNPNEGCHTNFRYKEAYCSVCGKKLDPLKMVMDGETVSGKTELRKLYGKNASVEVGVYDYKARKGYTSSFV
jgi:hypothetical protein